MNLDALKRHKKAAGLAAAAVAVVVVARKGAGASSAQTPAQTGQLNPSQGGYYDSTANDVYNSIEPQIQALAAQVSAMTPGASSPTAPAPAPKPKTPAPKPKPKPKPKKKPAPKPKPVGHALTYTVRRNDTLGGIAQRLHVNVNTLYNANRRVIGKDKNLIRPGERLTYSR